MYKFYHFRYQKIIWTIIFMYLNNYLFNYINSVIQKYQNSMLICLSRSARRLGAHFSTYILQRSVVFLSSHLVIFATDIQRRRRFIQKKIDLCDISDLSVVFVPILGPREWYSGVYKPLLWLLLIGAILPVPFWLLHKKYPRTTWLKYVHIPILLMPVAFWYRTSSTETSSWLLFGFACHLLIHRWWYNHYSLLFSITMDIGGAISGAIRFFIFKDNNIRYPEWWGTRIDDRYLWASWTSFPDLAVLNVSNAKLAVAKYTFVNCTDQKLRRRSIEHF